MAANEEIIETEVVNDMDNEQVKPSNEDSSKVTNHILKCGGERKRPHEPPTITDDTSDESEVEDDRLYKRLRFEPLSEETRYELLNY